MKSHEVRQILTDFFTPDTIVVCEKIPNIMELKAQFIEELAAENCKCSSSKVKLTYSAKLKKILYGR